MLVELGCLIRINARQKNIFMFKVAVRDTGILVLSGRISLWLRIFGEIQTVPTLPLNFYNLILVGLEC